MDTGSILSLVSSVTNLGAFAVFFVLFVRGDIHSDAEVQRLYKDLEAERKVTEITQQALQVAQARAETSNLTGQILMQALGQKPSNASVA